MAQKQTLKLKEILLLAFVGVCVVLVVLIWWEGLSPDDSGSTGFVRSTAVIEVDQEAYENWNALEPTPTPTLQPGE